MGLREVERLDPEPAERGFGETADLVAGEAVGPVVAAELGGDKHARAGARRLAEETADDGLAAAAAIDVRRVEERDPGLVSGAQGGERGLLGHVAPVAPELPGAKTDFTGAADGAESAGMHRAGD